jgi:signal transduction histidine kinase
MTGQRGSLTVLSPAVAADTRDEVKALIEEHLRQVESSIVATPESVQQLRSQVDAVLDDVAHQLRHGASTFSPGLSAEIGASRAASGVPPAESLYAASVLFEVALGVLTRSRSMAAEQTLTVTLCLHRSIMKRVGHGAASYVNFLLQRIQDSHREERKRVARELHDRPAHGVGVALQSLDLHELYAGTDSERAACRLQVARESLREAMDSIKRIATELRDTLAGRDLGQALTSYLDRCTPPATRTSVGISGDPRALAPPVAEELYLVLREAMHNVLLHAAATAIDVQVRIGATAVTAEVSDDGIGFEPARASGIGLTSMRERLELLGGTLEVTSALARGARVRAMIPLFSQLT